MERLLTVEEIAERLSDRSIKEVSRRLGISCTSIHDYIHGRAKPGYKNLLTLTEYLTRFDNRNNNANGAE